MKTTRRCAALAMTWLVLGCSGSDDASTASRDETKIAKSNVERVDAATVPASDLTGVAVANNAFGLDLYGEVLKQGASTNVLASPISASLALTMTYAGALGETRAQMAKVLHLDALPENRAFAGQNALSQALGRRAAAALAQDQNDAEHGRKAPDPADYHLQLVNSVWGEQSYAWEGSFLDILAANYGTGVRQESFKTAFDAARVRINDWVSANTNDKIKDLLPERALNAQTRLVLVNALHLKLPWETAFMASATRPAAFERGDATSVTTEFMSIGKQLAYVDDGKAQIVAIPLNNRELSVVITLPHEDVTLADYEAALTPTSDALVGPKSNVLVDLSLPKVKFTTQSFSLSGALKALGMTAAFDRGKADFTGIAKPQQQERLYVSDVLQKAMIGIGESGVEAAAATAVLIAGTASTNPSPQLERVEMTVNRPYLVSIVDNPTGAVLMLGHIQDPTEKGRD